MADLKICPWCGEPPVLKPWLDDGACMIHKGSCDFVETTLFFDSVEEAIEAWNTRTPEQAIAATLGSERHVETCEIESEVWHDHGGYDSDTYEWVLSCGHSVEWLDNKPPKHCPECGAKVVTA